MPFDSVPSVEQEAKPKLISPSSVLLLRARLRIDRAWRWRQGQKVSSWPWARCCAIGALEWADENYDMGAPEAFDRAMGMLNEAARAHGFCGILSMNDHPDTTHRQVLEVLLEAAELAKEEA